MAEKTGNYHGIVKVFSLFGGIQIANIMMSIVRSKAIAVWIGPSGIGISGLFGTAINLITILTGVGLETSGVREISAAADKPASLQRQIAILRWLSWIFGLIAGILTLVLSPILSRLTFGTSAYSAYFAWIALSILFKQITGCETAILQGLRKLRHLALANLLGGTCGLLISFPLYYKVGIPGIVAGIVVSAIATFVFAIYFTRNIQRDTDVTFRIAFTEGKVMLKMGVMLAFSSAMAALANYLIQIFVVHSGGIVESGFYNAGTMLINTYTGVVFTAMATDYFPRLSQISADNQKVNETVLQQATAGIFIITPIILCFLFFAPFLIPILYSTEFKVIISLVSIGIIGMFFRVVSWSIGYVFLAKGDSSVFIKTAIGFNILFLVLNIWCYYIYGLEGIGIAFTIYYFIHLIALVIIANKRYGFQLNREFYSIFLTGLIFCTLGFLFTFIGNFWLKFALSLILISVSGIYSFRKLSLQQFFKFFSKK